MEASKKTKGRGTECSESTQKTDSKANYEMDISALYESYTDNSNRRSTCDPAANRSKRDSELSTKFAWAGLQKILWIGALMRNVGL